MWSSALALGAVLALSGGAGRKTDACDELVSLLRERLLISREVAKAKHNSGAAVEDRERERAVVEAAVRASQGSELSPRRVRAIWSAQIEASKMVQRQFLARWQSRGRFDWAPDLRTQVRPRLDRVGASITGVLPAVARTVRSPRGAARFRRLAGHVSWPQGEAYAFRAAWKAAIAPIIEETAKR